MVKGSNKNIKGFALVEMIIYLAIMVLITLVVVQSIVVVFKSNNQSFLSNSISNSAITSLEKMTREIRNARSVDSPSGSILQLTSVDASGNSQNSIFYVDPITSRLMASSSNVSGPLTSSNVIVTSLKFTPITTSSSKAVKIEMTISGNNQTTVESENFMTTVILRGSY